MAVRTIVALFLVLAPVAPAQSFNGKSAAQWLEQMRQGDSQHDRDYAQWALGRMGDRAIASITRALDDPDTEVRLRALALAADFGPAMAPATERLRGLAQEPDRRVAIAAQAALLRATARREDLPRLIAMLGSDERRLCMAAVGTIASFGADAAPAVAPLADLLGKGERFYTAVKVTRLEHAETQAEGVHLEVVRALGRLGATAAPAVPALAQALRHDSAWVRTAAIEALGEIGAPAAAAIPDLIAQLEARDWGNRRDAIIALSQIAAAAAGEQPDVVRALIGRLSDAVDYVRSAACHGLQRLGPRASAAVPALLALLTDADQRSQRAREPVIEALGAIGSAARDAVPTLEGIVATDERHGETAVRALAAIAPEQGKTQPRVAARLKELAESKLSAEEQRELRIRRALARIGIDEPRERVGALVELGWLHAREAAPALVKLLGTETDLQVRRAAIGVLGDLGARDTAAQIRPFLDDPAVRDVAAFTLARFIDPPSMPRLLELLADPAAPEREALGTVFAASGVRDAAPILRQWIEGEEPGLACGFAVHLLRDPSFASIVHRRLTELARTKEPLTAEQIEQRATWLVELAALDPASHREMLAAHLDDADPPSLRRGLAKGLARVQEPRAFPVLLASGEWAALNHYLAPALVARLDDLWLDAVEHEGERVSDVAATIGRRLQIKVEFSPAVSPAQRRARRDLGEAYEFVPHGLRLRACHWLDGLASGSGWRAEQGGLGWLPADGGVRIVTAAEAEGFWREEAPRRASRPASEPAPGSRARR